MTRRSFSNDELRTVAKTFSATGNIIAVECLKSGHINDTYKITYQNGNSIIDYVLQRINSTVFPEPVMIMENIEAVAAHIRSKYESFGWDINNVLFPLRTLNNMAFWLDSSGSYWRMYSYIKGGVCYDKAPNAKIMRSIGRAFGMFQMLLSDFPAKQLNIIIPDFHNTKARFAALEAAAIAAAQCEELKGRYNNASELLFVLEAHKWVAFSLEEQKEKGILPLRVTHNDTKCNNVMLDSVTDESLAVIDLDTVMPGLCAHDFGDSVRAGANNADEDETDLTKVYLDIDKFTAFAEGFIPALEGSLTKPEYESLALGAPVIALELAARFLTDYLCGDRYFKVLYPEHNFDRAKCQLTLALDMLNKLEKLDDIIKGISLCSLN